MTTTPPFLLGAALVFWGLQTGYLLFAIVMGLILEAAHWIKTRWQFSEEEYNRVFDLCGLLLIGAGAIASTSDDHRVPALILALWFPFIFFPIMAAQAYGNRPKLTMRTLNWFFLRRRKTGLANKELNISYLYFGLCILSASAAPPNSSAEVPVGTFGMQTFYFVVAILLSWALLSLRPRRLHVGLWLVLITAVVAIGHAGHLGLQQAQQGLESLISDWVGKFGRHDLNMMEAQTAIGRIGRLQQSDRILLRVEPESGAAPELLRQMSYDLATYADRRLYWQTGRRDSNMVPIDSDDSWKIVPDVEAKRSVRISGNLFRGTGVLALPMGTVELHDLPVGGLTTNLMGMARVEGGTKFIRFLAHYNPGTSFDAEPNYAEGAELWQVPERDQDVLFEIAKELGLFAPIPDEEKLRAINRFFLNEFVYSTYLANDLSDQADGKSPLGQFLTKTRAGHCEYFATASVLLARVAGIPARYATGFSVQEPSEFGNMYVVRARHAHAWAMVYHNGAWHDFDTTPGTWADVEGQNAALWRPLADLWSRLKFELSRWRYSESDVQKYAFWLLIPLIVFLAWRILFRKRRKHAGGETGRELQWPGLDSEMYQVEQELTQRGLVRDSGEPLVRWKERVLHADCVPPEAFVSAVDLHTRHRFDPEGLNADDRQKLRDDARECLRVLRLRSRDQALAASNSHAG